MTSFVGIAVVLIMVFGGYMAAGGKFDIILQSLPFELMIIGGAAIGAFLISNQLSDTKQSIKDLKRVFKGVHWVPEDYQDVLCLMFELIRLSRTDPVALEQHIEDPQNSSVFLRYPKIQRDAEAVSLICDTLRSASMNYDDPHQVENVIENRIDKNLQHALHSSHALQTMADGLPALGIVAAVLGVIKTMASIDQPADVLGKLIGSALVGTFLGVFLSYGFVGPFAGKVRNAVEQDHQFYQLIREVLVANLYNHAIDICIEVGRQGTPKHVRPSFHDLEDALNTIKKEAA